MTLDQFDLMLSYLAFMVIKEEEFGFIRSSQVIVVGNYKKLII
jgi:hypothetical protein